jgi:hypothetical protein
LALLLLELELLCLRLLLFLGLPCLPVARNVFWRPSGAAPAAGAVLHVKIKTNVSRTLQNEKKKFSAVLACLPTIFSVTQSDSFLIDPLCIYFHLSGI